MYGQDNDVIIKVQDTVAVGTPFKLEIELNNIQGKFTTPEFQGLRLVGGPSTSSSFTMINGETNSKSTYVYYLLADESGTYFIKLYDIQTREEVLTFDEIRIEAVENKTSETQVIKYFDSSKPGQSLPEKSKRKIRKI